MSKLSLNKILVIVLMIVTAELGAVFGMFVVKSHFFASSFNPINIHGIPGAYTVTSGSMEPSISTGTLVLSIPVSDYQVGDVITFRNSMDSKTLITHRIHAKFYSDESKEFVFYTKGDANKSLDGAKIKYSEIAGKTIIGIPFLGYVANSVKDPKMFILFVIIPITIIVYEELRFLKKEFSKLVRIYIKKVKPKFDKIGDDFNDVKGVNKSTVLIPFLGIVLVLSGITGSFFKDSDISFGKTFTTGTFPTPVPIVSPIPTSSPSPTPVSTPTPTAAPNHIVINEIFVHNNTKQQWVELYNGTGSAVSLNGWTITDNNGSDTLPNISIAAGSYVVIVTSDTVVSGIPGSPVITINLSDKSIGGNNFDLAGDRLTLKNNSSTVVDSVSYGTDTTYFTMTAPPNSNSLYRHPNGSDNDTALNWVVSASSTLGLANP